MAGPKASSAASEQQHGQKVKQQGSKPDPISYKSKLMAPSDHDDLSHPSEAADQDTNMPKLAPVEDEGSPPMVPDTPAGDYQAPSTPDQSNEPMADKEGFIPVGKHAQQASSTGADVDEAGGKDTGNMDAGAGAVPPEVLSQDTPAGVALSDLEKEALAEPSTADLVASATGASPPSDDTPTPTEDTPTDKAAAATAADEDTSPTSAAPTAATGVQLLPDTETNQLAKGGTAAADSSGSSGVTSDTTSSGSSGQGAKGASAGAAAADASGNDSSLPTPAAARKMAGGEETMSPAAAAVDEGRAKAAAAAELPEQGGEGPSITPADFAATGLAALEAEADAAAAAKRGRGGSSGSSGGSGGGGVDRMSSVMTDRTDSGWYDRSYSSMLPSSTVELAGMDQAPAMEPLSEKSEEPFSEDGDAARRKSEDSTQPQSESNVSKTVSPVQRSPQSESKDSASAESASAESADSPPQHYGALAQAPAVSDDPAAVPAGTSDTAAAGGSDTAAAAAAASAAGGSGERVFAGQGSGKESGRGGVIVSAADLSDDASIQVLGDEEIQDILGQGGQEGGEGGESSAAGGGGEGAPASGADVSAAADASKGLLSSEATPAAGEATAASAVAPYMPAAADAPAGEATEGGDSSSIGGGEDGRKAAAVDALPFPLKVFDNAAKSVIDTVADAAEAVKDTLLGPDIDISGN